MTMTKYVPTWERQYDPWDREPEMWENDELDESDNAKEKDELSIDDLLEDEIPLDESEYDLDLE